MKKLKSQLNRKLQFHLDCITELSTIDYDFVHGLSDSDHKQAVNTLNEVLTQIKLNEGYDKVRKSNPSPYDGYGTPGHGW
jgi:hypothetical protein